MRRRGLVAAGIGVVALAAAAARGLLRRFAIVSRSMEPTLRDGDWVIARRRRRAPKRGDIVVFEHDDRPGVSIVKRVIGLPGETATIRGGQVFIDDVPLADPWANGFTVGEGSWEVPEGSVWVLGDLRSTSGSDSRVLGPIDLADIHWRVVARYWPSGRIGMIDTTP